MRTRRLGDTDLELTTVGLGTWAIGGPNWKFGWGPQDDDEAIAAVIRAIELGINWVDTAPVYGDGRAEELVGRALQSLPAADRPIVATKCTRIVQPDGSVRGRMTAAGIRAECEASLQRLGVDVIDLYQLHWPDPPAQIEAGWTTLVELKAQGKVRHIGVSNFDVGQLERVAAIHPVASLQPPYSMLARGVESAELPWCAEHGTGVVAYSPMLKGILTGRFDAARAASLPDDDHRSRDPDFHPPRLEANLALVDGLRTIAARHGRSVAQLAIGWVLRRNEVTAAIVGARSPDQIEDTAKAGDWTLDQGELTGIETLLAARDAAVAGS